MSGRFSRSTSVPSRRRPPGLKPTTRYDPSYAEVVKTLQILEREGKERENPGYKSKKLKGLKKKHKELGAETIVETIHKWMHWKCRSCTHLQDEAKRQKDELTESQRVNKDVEAQLQRQQEDEQILEKNLETYKKDIENLNNQIHSLQDEKKRIKDDLNESQKAHKDLDAQVQRQQEDEQTLKKNLETCKQKCENLNNQIQRTEDECRKATEKWHELQSENEGLQRELQEADQTSKENQEIYTREKKDLSDQLHNLQGERNRQEKTLDKTLRENQALNERTHRLRAEVDTERKAKDDALLRLHNLQGERNRQEKTLDKTLRENQALNERIQLLQGDVKRLRDNFSASERENQNLNEWIHRLKAEKETETKAKADALLRLRAIASGRLRDNNPNITDLSDENRPTKLGEKMCELYYNEWTDAFDVLESEYDEFKCIQLLLQVFETAFVEISKKATKQMELVTEAITWEDQDAKELIKAFKDMRKKKTGFFIIEHSPEIAKTVSEIVGSAADSKPLQTYIDKSIECCWIMVVQDPPLCLHKSQLFESFDTKLYREYTARGPFLQFVVWPTVLLHKDGPILAKGVAQGGPVKEVKEDVDPQSRSAEEQAQTGGNQGGVVNSNTEDPDITDLSDENRPTKLGEKMCELYDNEWTDAFDVLESEYDEFKCIQLLLQVFETAFVEISKKATKQMEIVREAITWEDQDAKELIKTFKDMRKKKTGFFIIEHFPEITKTVSEIVGSAAGSKPLQTYIDKSIECCWIMVVQDPPLCLHKSQLFESFDYKLYREYTARGPFLQFVVWPTALLHKGGPILAKGVAQGGPVKEVKEDVDPQSWLAGEQAQTGGNQGYVVNSHTENPSDIDNNDNNQADVDIKYTGIDRKIR